MPLTASSSGQTPPVRKTLNLAIRLVGLLLLGAVTLFALPRPQPPSSPLKVADEARFRRASELAGQALADLESGRCTVARDRLLEVNRLLPDNLLPKINLAICYAMLDQRASALQWLEQARHLSPENPQALFATARILEPLLAESSGARKLWEDSLTVFERTQPGDPRPHYLRGTAASRASLHTDALRHFQQALQRAPENLALLLAGLTVAAQTGLFEETEDSLNALEDRLNGFDQRAQQYADQLRDAIAAEQLDGLRPPALILQNLLRPTDLFRVGLTELLGRGDGTQLFAQLDFDPPLPPSIQGGQDIDVDWVERTSQWLGSQLGDQQEGVQATVGRDGTEDSLWLTTLKATVEVVGGPGKPDTRALRSAATGSPAQATLADQSLLVDMNQDGIADLVTLYNRVVRVAHRTASSNGLNLGKPSSVDLPTAGGRLIAGDVDQEGDLDLLVLRANGPTLFLQNRGSGGLVVTPLDLGQTAASDARIVDLDDDGDLDIVFAGVQGIIVLDNLRGGSYRDTTDHWLPVTIQATRIEVADFNNDGRFDLLAWGKGQQTILENTEQGFEAKPLPSSGKTKWSAVTVLDFDNDGDEDLAFGVTDGSGVGLYRNLRERGFSREKLSESLNSNAKGAASTQIIAADLDQDGDLDLVTASASGARVFRNDGGSDNQWLRVRLQGLYDNNSKNNIQGHGTKVEVRSGGAYQAKLGDGRVQHFGLGSNRRSEVLRVLWTNGLAQTQQQLSSRQTLLEKQVLKGSCPFLYTWNGTEFEFHTDLMWRSTLGMTFSDGSPAPHQSARDWILIPGPKLQPAAGKYWLNTTAELWETIYLDKQELLVVDHPQEIELVVDETFGAPPHPSTAPLHWVQDERPPVAAINHHGENILDALLARDQKRVSNLPLTRYQGVTREHFIDLTFDHMPNNTKKTLLLWGWIFPTDTSINVALAQDPGLAAAPPRLEVLGQGGWRSLVPSIGLPMGKRKAMVIHFDHLLTASERSAKSLRLRVTSTMQIYWNKASLSLAPSSDAPASPFRVTHLEPMFADLHYRGFSAQEPRAADEPHLFTYSQVDTRQRFRDLEGAYTAYGEVLEQTKESDNSMVIMNAGDELSFAYDASRVPPLPDGWVRNFVLFTDGWVKDGDLHTRFSQTVSPLPSHQMSSYPDKNPPEPIFEAGNRRQVSGTPFADALRNSQQDSPLP